MMIAVLCYTLVIGKEQSPCFFMEFNWILIQAEGSKIIITALAKGAIMQKQKVVIETMIE